jgi:hypothetical protein
MRRTALTIFVVAMLYYITLLILGPIALTRQLTKDSNSTYHEFRWTDQINVVGNVDVEVISKIFSGPGLKITLLRSANDDEIAQSFLVQRRYNYLVVRDSRFKPLVTVHESEKIDEYVADWEKKYVWCFAFWVTIENRMTGIS